MRPLRGLYAITDGRHGDALLDPVDAVLRGGAVLVQYRDKSGDRPRRRAEATALLALCRRHRARLLINDDVELAAAVGADGVHLGRDDGSLAAARERLGPGALIGVSCYADPARARDAARAGADYLAFGSVHPSPTKPHAVRAPLEL
ncbi:MAG TPA: thiamine phosphate synthase, partial [Gammaproteobacteria bacterium]